MEIEFISRRQLLKHLRGSVAFILVVIAMSSRAETNSWIKATDGLWQEANSWSLGILPDSSQSVAITNSGEKTVTIDQTTAQNFPQSLTVKDVIVGGSNTTFMLDHIGTNQPFAAINGMSVVGVDSTNKNTLALFQSSLIASNGGGAFPLYLMHGQVIQHGGHVILDGPNYFDSSDYYLTNGTLKAGGIKTYEGTFLGIGSSVTIGFLNMKNGSRIIQSGGSIQIGTLSSEGGELYLSNCVFSAGDVYFGDYYNFDGSGAMHQYDGAAAFQNLHVGYRGGAGVYEMFNGMVTVSTDLEIGFPYNGSGKFVQHAGRVDTGSLEIEPYDGTVTNSYTLFGGELNVARTLRIGGDNRSFGAQILQQENGTVRAGSVVIGLSASSTKSSCVSEYLMDDGTLLTTNITVKSGWYTGRGLFQQNGGSNTVVDTLAVSGGWEETHFNSYPIYGTYALTNGVLSAQKIDLNGGELELYSAVAQCGTLQLRGGKGSFAGEFPASYLLVDNGFVSCQNVISGADGGGDIAQTGGSVIVSNLLSFGGFVHTGMEYSSDNEPEIQAVRYRLSGGTLYASNIDLAAEMIIGSSTQTGRITNPGYFKMSGTLTSGDATEQLGRFILASNSVINLGNGAAKLSFAKSSAEAWDGAAKLLVTNWNGSLTGGADDQLRFGNDASALTAAQLNQIRFVNPSGFPSGEFLAQILSTGEVVPKARPALSLVQSGANLVLSWPDGFALQTATNVAGPYEDVSGATSPHTNDFAGSPERYFRLRQ